MMLIPQEPKCEPLLIPVERKEIMSSSYIIIAVFGVLDVLLAAYAFSAYFKKVSSKATEIEAALSQLQEFDEHDYSMRFEDINNVLIKNQTIKEMWRDFSHNLTRVRTPEGKDELYSPVDASDFFRYNLAIKDINNGFWQNYGNIFTGLGILGTFLGLMIGLAGVDLSSSDVAVLYPRHLALRYWESYLRSFMEASISTFKTNCLNPCQHYQKELKKCIPIRQLNNG